MPKFCGKCGNLLLENGSCPNCDKPAQVSSPIVPSSQQPINPSVEAQPTDSFFVNYDLNSSDIKPVTKKKKHIGIKITAIVLAVIILISGVFGTLVYFDILNVPFLKSAMQSIGIIEDKEYEIYSTKTKIEVIDENGIQYVNYIIDISGKKRTGPFDIVNENFSKQIKVVGKAVYELTLPQGEYEIKITYDEENDYSYTKNVKVEEDCKEKNMTFTEKDKPTQSASKSENKEKTEEKLEEKNFGNIVSYNNCLYYWKYNSDSFTDEAASFANYSNNENALNQLICRNNNGEEKVILTTNGFSNIAIVNNRIYFQTCDGRYYYKIKSCSLSGNDVKEIDKGALCGIINNGKYVIYQSQHGSGVFSINTDTDEVKTVSNDVYLICSDDSIICTKSNGADKLIDIKISVYKIDGDGSNKKELYVNKASELESSQNEDGYLSVEMPFIKDNYVYFAFEHIAGTGHVTQSAIIMKVDMLSGTAVKIGGDYVEDTGQVIVSQINDSDYKEYIDNYTNPSTLDEVDYSDFSSSEIDKYNTESDTVVAEYCEEIGDKRYVLLTCNDFVSWNGWRQTYQFRKCALYEKDLSTGKAVKLYDTSNTSEN